MVITRKRYFNPLTFFGCNALKFVSINNKECKVRTEIRNINSNEPSFCPTVFLQINAVAVIIILMIHVLNHAFLI